MDKSVLEEISYYFETFLDKVKKLRAKWGYLSWETKVRTKGIVSVLGLGLAYMIYSGSWISLSGMERSLLIIFAILLLGIFLSTILEVLDFKHV